MKQFLFILIASCSLLAQGVVLGGNGVIGGNTKIGQTPATGGTVTFVASGEGFVTGTTDSFTLPATTGSGHILYVGDGAGGSGGHLSSITGGGTWVIPAGCAVDESIAGFGTSCGYVLSSSSGATTITLNWSGSSMQHIWWYYEYSCSATAGFDTSGSFDQTSSTNPVTGIALTLGGIKDLIFQMVKTSFDVPSGISAPYGQFNSDSNQLGWATSENTTSGAAPTWTASNTNRWAAGALAIQCQ